MTEPGTVNPPTVSVVMAAYNGAGLIGETLASLRDQTLPDWEAIVVDDGSSDATRDIVSSWPDPRVRLIALPQNGGPVRARNEALRHATGRYIAGLDQDDLCRPDRFAAQVAFLDAHPHVALAGTAVEFLRDGRVLPSTYPAVTSPVLTGWLAWIENPLAWSSVMVRADVARALDPFTRPDILYAEDFDLYHRVAPFGGIARLDTPLVLYRQHAGGISRRYRDQMEVSATAVLTARHASLLGKRAEAAARALVVHNMGGRPVQDRATLALLGSVLAQLRDAYLAEARPGEADRRLIHWHTADRWTRIGRIALREGTLTLADMAAMRHGPLGSPAPPAPAWSRLVGAARNLGVQTLAAKIIRPGPSRANT
ncbi:glycosyltransferase family 2 protein [Microvirga sp. SRT01]|uniref:Glycosyltransferase family 2 protein n=1 Tax=Sphingomonas longa TaxID=2778730 RepID=A0ABS2D778_9SPHN|nr:MULTISPECIES: glycosyltransferase family 2 protein [Alphaproteobacteria]MBM6576748.1 glycosyltransferase family 2 protein [Sphingomonas sp. BT552]MBR7709793.1 glycosyltransferase family 2 protein [Microvirga sp. SRT01]